MSIITSALLLKGGSMLLNALGSAKGGKTKQVTDVLSNVIDAVQGKRPDQQLSAVANTIDNLTGEERKALAEIERDLKQIETQREQNQYQYNIAMHNAQQKTIQNGDNSQGEYTRQTRPKMARFSGYIGSAYVIGMEVLSIALNGTGANWQLATLLFSPLLAYMGFRTFDAFSPYKGKKI